MGDEWFGVLLEKPTRRIQGPNTPLIGNRRSPIPHSIYIYVNVITKITEHWSLTTRDTISDLQILKHGLSQFDIKKKHEQCEKSLPSMHIKNEYGEEYARENSYRVIGHISCEENIASDRMPVLYSRIHV